MQKFIEDLIKALNKFKEKQIAIHHAELDNFGVTVPVLKKQGQHVWVYIYQEQDQV